MTVFLCVGGLTDLHAESLTLHNCYFQTETEKPISLSVLSDDTPEVGEEYSLMLQNIITQGWFIEYLICSQSCGG